MLKILQFFFKFLATIFSKLGAKYTYVKLYKLFMKYKLIKIIYKPLSFIFSNFIYFFKLISAIIAVLSLFNVSLLYYNFDIMDEINNLINQIINWVRYLINEWYPNEIEDDIPEPNEFTKSRKNNKLIEKSIQKPNYYVIPIILIGYGMIYYYNSDILEILNPLLDKTVINFPNRSFDVFIIGTFIYKGITFSIQHFTGYDLNIFEDKPKDSDTSSDIEQYFRQPEDDFPNNEDRDYIREIVQSTGIPAEEATEAWQSEDNEETPRISTINLPNNTENRPSIGENPFRITTSRQITENSVEIRVEDWLY